MFLTDTLVVGQLYVSLYIKKISNTDMQGIIPVITEKMKRINTHLLILKSSLRAILELF